MTDLASTSKLKLKEEVEHVKTPVKKVIEKPPFRTSNTPMPKLQGVKILAVKAPKKNLVELPPLKLRKIPWNPEVPKIQRKPLKKYDQIHYASKFSTLGKAFKKYKYVNDTLAIMRGKISQNSKKFSYISNGKQSSFISIIALISSTMTSSDNWNPQDIDDIINTGDMNYRKRAKKFDPNQIITPLNLTFQMYFDLAKIQTRVGQAMVEGVYMTDKAQLLAEIIKFLEDYSRLVVNFGAQNFAIWKENKAYYLFNSEDTQENGDRTDKYKGAACIARTKNLEVLVDYLTSCLKYKSNPFTIFSFEVQPFTNLKVFKKPSLVDLLRKSSSKEFLEFETTQETTECSEVEGVVEKISSMEFSDFYEYITETQGFLKSKVFLTATEREKAPYISCSAIAMLRIAKSHLWVSKTISEVFRIGFEMFTNSSKKVKDTNSPITDRKLIFQFGKHSLEIMSENVVFGSLTSRKLEVVNLADGLKFFFETFDCGIIQGPDTVAVWQEKGLFYLMDPYKCERQLRTVKEQNDGNSCLNWFRNIEDLTKHYLANISKENRKDFFKICSVEVVDHIKKSDRWCNFKPLTDCKWILSGTISQNDDQFLSSDRNMQGTACSVLSLAYSQIWGVQSWDSKSIDDIVKNGNKFHRSSIYGLKESGQFVDNNLRVGELPNQVSLKKTIIDLNYDEAVINGVLNGVKDEKDKKVGDCEKTYSLEQGLNHFFECDNMAVLIFCGVSIAIFKQKGCFFVFDSHDRDKNGNKFLSTKIPGTACVVRFTNISDMSKHLIANYSTTSNDPYNISKVEIIVRSNESYSLNNYIKIKDCDFGAILYPLNRFHEDHSDYNMQGKSVMMMYCKTICNLVTCLGFTEIHDPRMWSSSDLNEIFKLGMKHLKELPGNYYDADVIIDEENILEMIEDFQIGSVHIRISLAKLEKGSFKSDLLAKPEKMDPVEKPLKNPSILGYFDTEDKKEIEETINRSSMQSIFSSVLDVSENMSLAQMLKSWEKQSTVFALLSSNLFKLAIWKKDNTYYVFDSKETDEDGKLVKWRLQEFSQFRKKTEKNFREERLKRRTIAIDQVDAEHTEVTEGKLKHFMRPSLAPSMHNLSIGKLNVKNFVAKGAGSSYVARFSTYDLLVDHILSKIPEEYHTEPISLHYLTLTRTVDVLPVAGVKWHRFSPIQLGSWLLRASISQNDIQFSAKNRNNQDVANCVMALNFAQISSASEWKTVTLDIILKYGDRLYSSSMHILRQIEKVVDDPKITLDQLDLPVRINDLIFTMNYKLVMKKKLDSFVFDELSESFSEGGLIMIDNFYMAIWKDGQDYFMFDPHENGPLGIPRTNGVACLHRFTELTALNKIFANKKQSLELSFYRISIVKTLVEQSNVSITNDIADQESFLSEYDFSKLKEQDKASFGQELVNSLLPLIDPLYVSGDGDHVKDNFTALMSPTNERSTLTQNVVHGKLSKISKKFCPVVKEKHAGAICVVAAAMSTVNNPESWTKDVIDAVLEAGNCVFMDSCIVNGKKDIEITEIIQKLHIGKQEVELVMIPISTAKFNSKTLKTSLVSLTTSYQIAYLAYNLDCFTLFFENGFFLFDPLGMKVQLKKNPVINIRRATLYKFDDLEAMVDRIGEILQGNGFDGFMQLGGILKTMFT